MKDFFREKILLFRLRRRDKDAFAEMYDEFVDKIYRFVLLKVSSVQEAEDITSEVFLKTWEYIGREGTEIRNLSAFLYQMSRNLVIDFYRHRGRRETVSLSASEDQLENIPDEKIKIDEKVSQDLAAKELQSYLSRLGEEYKEVVLLRFIEDFSTKEIAKILGKQAGNIRVMLHRAMKLLESIAVKKHESRQSEVNSRQSDAEQERKPSLSVVMPQSETMMKDESETLSGVTTSSK